MPRILLVTEVGRDMGLALARRLAGAGHRVVGVARQPVEGFPGELVPLDLGDHAAAAAFLHSEDAGFVTGQILHAGGGAPIDGTAGPEGPALGGLARWQAKRAREMVEANLCGGLRLADLAAACGLSTGHFARAFRVTIGMTPHRWLLHRRVARAKALIRAGDLPLAAIAGACGFSDQSHMSRVFRRLTGITPARWRREQGRSHAPIPPRNDA